MKSIIVWGIAVIGVMIYMLPTNIAFTRRTTNRIDIFMLNLFLGWTVIVWIILLIKSLKAETVE